MNIKVYLRDKDKRIVKAWTNEFCNYSNVEISSGDIFDIKADAIISPANSFGFMDGGIDLIYSKYFGRGLQKKLQRRIRADFYGELPVGMAAIIETGHKNIKYLVSCPTMRVPEDVSNTVNAYLAFRAGLIEVINFNKNNDIKVKNILCPGLGTSIGMMSPENCARQMKYAYDIVFNKNIEFPKNLFAAYDYHKILTHVTQRLGKVSGTGEKRSKNGGV